MSKKIDILGVCVDNYTVRESLMRLDTYLGSTVLNIIETVTMEQLIAAGENAVIKDCLEQADLCIIGSGFLPGIAKAGGTQPEAGVSFCRD